MLVKSLADHVAGTSKHVLADHVAGTSKHVLYQTNGDNQFPYTYILLGKSRMIVLFLENVLSLK